MATTLAPIAETVLAKADTMTATDTTTKQDKIHAANAADLQGGNSPDSKYIGTATRWSPEIEEGIDQNWEQIDSLWQELVPSGYAELVSPNTGEQETMTERITRHRDDVRSIVSGESDTTGVIVGPCSVHNEEAMMRYIDSMAELQRQINANGLKLKIILRIYGEKPRSSNMAGGEYSWRGAVSNPHPEKTENNDAIQTEEGLQLMERLMAYAYAAGDLAVATEFLNMETVERLGPWTTMTAVGARTSHLDKFQQMAAYLARLGIVTGFKNGENGEMQPAIEAIRAAQAINPNMLPLGILRGGSNGPNWDEYPEWEGAGLPTCVDYAHSQTGKDLRRTENKLAKHAKLGLNKPRIAMFEGWHEYGRQDIIPGVTPDAELSVTDNCLDIRMTQAHILAMAGMQEQTIIELLNLDEHEQIRLRGEIPVEEQQP